MAVVNNLALVAFCEAVATELLLAQVLVRRGEPGFELRHVSDRAAPSESLKLVQLHDLRALANHTAAGEFRPIKAAPNLRPGWRCLAKSDSELAAALEQLYPGAVADWFALRQPEPTVTHYRDFTARQSGMYRITAMLTDPQAAQVTRACCDERFCLKRRCWTVPGLAPDAADTLGEPAYWCATDTCPVAYFDLFERSVDVAAAHGLYWPKDAAGPLCCCHGLTVDDVDADLAERVPVRVRAVVEQAGRSDAACATKSPDGRPCVARVQRYYLRRKQKG